MLNNNRVFVDEQLNLLERILNPPAFYTSEFLEALRRRTDRAILYSVADADTRRKMDQEDLKDHLKSVQAMRREPRPDLGPSLQIQIQKDRARAKRKRREIRKLKHQAWKQWKGRKRLAEINFAIASSAGGMQDPKS